MSTDTVTLVSLMTWQGALIAETETAIADHAPPECRRDALYIVRDVFAEATR